MTTGDPYCAIHRFNPCRCREFNSAGPFVGPFTTTTGLPTCPHCGLMHNATCPRIKAIEYHENGLTKRIEFHDGQQFSQVYLGETGTQVMDMTALDVVREQAEDEGLWFVAGTVTEAHLQAALRRLHEAVERGSVKP